jgi:hypothetical protein
MLKWVNSWKRPAMGWVGLGGVVIALFWEPAILELRFVVLTISIALLCLAMPARVWASFRTWWTD